MKYLLPLILFCCACTQKDQTKASFSSFEISSFNGHLTAITFYADSGGIYINPQSTGGKYCGPVPDSLRRLIDSILNIINHKGIIRSNTNNSYGNRVVSVCSVTDNDTFRVIQHGRLSDIHPLLYQIVKRILPYDTMKPYDEKPQRIIKHNLKTYKDIVPQLPPPPPIVIPSALPFELMKVSRPTTGDTVRTKEDIDIERRFSK